MAKIHDLFIIELAEVIKGYGNDPDVEDPFRMSEFYRFYELPNIAVSRENFEKMRPAQPEQRWIPCSERLPENNDPVNVTWVNHNPEVYYADIKDKPFTATAHYHNGRWYWFSSVTQDYLNEYDVWTPDLVDKDVEITAWMPIPEPYREDIG